jgi:hypothetical protein
MAHITQLAFGAFISTLGVKGHSKLWEFHEHDQQFRENEMKDIGRSQRLRREHTARINQVSAVKPGLATIIGKVLISSYCQCPDADFHIPVNACSIDYADTWSLKKVH